jgi:hypothetical protein
VNKRQYLTPHQMRDLLIAQAGVCAAPNCMSEGPFEADHSTPNALQPGKPDQLLCKPCHARKTKRDVKAIAKVKRLNGTTSSQWSRRKQNGSRIKSKGFEGWRSLSGEIRTRSK